VFLFGYTGVPFWVHPISYKPLLLLTFFTFLFSLLYIGLKVPKGTGSIFENFTQKSPPSELKSRFVNPHLKAIAFLFNSVLAELFSAGF